MIEESKKLCEAFKPCGPLTVQLIQDKNTGDNYYIEINPRYGGGAPLSMKAGARSAEALLKLLSGEQVKYQENSCNGAIYSRFDQSMCISEGDDTQPIKGVKVGIITDGRPDGQRNKIKALGLESLVDDIIITDELGGPQFRKKPCDIAFRIMQNRWRLPYEQIIYVGDNPNKDFQACRQLGMRWKYFRNEDGLYFDGETAGMSSILEFTI